MAFVVALMGRPGVGKLTVARSIADSIEADGETVRVVDNHWINNPIFGLVDQDGVSSLPSEVWDRVGEVARAVFETVASLTPKDWHVVFTAYLDGVSDTGWPPEVARVAREREATLVPVRLLCEPEENSRRITQPGRREQMKSIDADEPYRLAALGVPYDPELPGTLTLDTTDLTPQRAATVILGHAAELRTNL